MVEKFLVDKMDDQPSHKKPKLGSSGSFDDLEAFKELNGLADIPVNNNPQMQQNGLINGGSSLQTTPSTSQSQQLSQMSHNYHGVPQNTNQTQQPQQSVLQELLLNSQTSASSMNSPRPSFTQNQAYIRNAMPNMNSQNLLMNPPNSNMVGMQQQQQTAQQQRGAMAHHQMRNTANGQLMSQGGGGGGMNVYDMPTMSQAGVMSANNYQTTIGMSQQPQPGGGGYAAYHVAQQQNVAQQQQQMAANRAYPGGVRQQAQQQQQMQQQQQPMGRGMMVPQQLNGVQPQQAVGGRGIRQPHQSMLIQQQQQGGGGGGSRGQPTIMSQAGATVSIGQFEQQQNAYQMSGVAQLNGPNGQRQQPLSDSGYANQATGGLSQAPQLQHIPNSHNFIGNPRGPPQQQQQQGGFVGPPTGPNAPSNLPPNQIMDGGGAQMMLPGGQPTGPHQMGGPPGGVMNGPAGMNGTLQQQQQQKAMLQGPPGGTQQMPPGAGMPGGGPMQNLALSQQAGPPQQLQMNGPPNPMRAAQQSSSTTNLSQSAQTQDPEKRKLIQQQLVLLLHAHKCQQRDKNEPQNASRTACSLPYCSTMKSVLEHMISCNNGRQCNYSHCASSRQIITHWKNCNKDDCPVCKPVKSFNNTNPDRRSSDLAGIGPSTSSQFGNSNPQQSAQGPQGQIGGGPPTTNNNNNNSLNGPQSILSSGVGSVGSLAQFGSPPSIPPTNAVNNLLMDYNPNANNMFRSNQPNKMGGSTNSNQMSQNNVANDGFGAFPPPEPPTQAKEWHESITQDLRNHLVGKLVKAIFPSPDPAAIRDQRIKDLIAYARKVEKEMFEAATDKEEYYHLLAEKIYKIQKELQEKKNRRLNEQQTTHSGESAEGGGYLPPQRSSNIPDSFQPIQQQQQQQSGGGGGSSAGLAAPSSIQGQLGQQSTNNNNNNGGGGGSILSGGGQIVRDIKMEAMPHQQQLNSQASNDSGFQSINNNNSSVMSQAMKPLKSEERCVAIPSTSGEQSIKSEPMDIAEPSITSRRSTPPPLKPNVAASSVPYSRNLVKEEIPVDEKIFDVSELRMHLKPICDKIYEADESFPFRVPVDPQLLKIPDYNNIIKHPMDLSTILSKLEKGVYKNPWEFCDDMWLMFENAWLYNRKNSKVYKYCTKLSEMFIEEINPIMVKMGYCCGQKLAFTPLALFCYGQSVCVIARDQPYYLYESASSSYGLTVSEKYIYCIKCFENLPEEGINLSETDSPPNWVPKTKFSLLKNDQINAEPFENCKVCLRKWHRICANYSKTIYSEFVCDHCRKEKNHPKPENKFTAKRLPKTELSNFIESRVNNYMDKAGSAGTKEQYEVVIRVLCATDKEVEVKTLMKNKYKDEFPEKFPYRCKAVFAFEVVDGVEVCFFGLHVQEYGNCLPPNQRRVYIAYLDSVHFFQPRHMRTDIYHEILLGYLEYVKRLGYMMAHIWACPPSEGDDYIFHCHPPEQKIPKPKRLQDWYKKMLDKGIDERTVCEYKDIYKQAKDDDLTTPMTLPYFEGDFWPNIIEDCIKDADKEESERKKNEQMNLLQADDDDEETETGEESRTKKNNSKSSNNKKKNNLKKSSQKSKKKGNAGTGNQITDKLFIHLEKHKEVFFTIRLVALEDEQKILSRPIADPDPLISCDLMDGRDTFLSKARDEHWEFSSLRRAKWSTMNFCHALHMVDNDSKEMTYTCNSCQMNAQFHCSQCDDYDLCEACYAKITHQHKMDKLIVEVDNKPNDSSANSRNESVNRCVSSLIHSCQCRDANCRRPTCQKMKKVVQHTKVCKKRQQTNCPVCKQMIALCCYHAKHCTANQCPVPFCSNIRQKLQEQKRSQVRRSEMMMRRRMEKLQTGGAQNGMSQNPSTSSIGGGGGGGPPSQPSPRLPTGGGGAGMVGGPGGPMGIPPSTMSHGNAGSNMPGGGGGGGMLMHGGQPHLNNGPMNEMSGNGMHSQGAYSQHPQQHMMGANQMVVHSSSGPGTSVMGGGGTQANMMSHYQTNFPTNSVQLPQHQQQQQQQMGGALNPQQQQQMPAQHMRSQQHMMASHHMAMKPQQQQQQQNQQRMSQQQLLNHQQQQSGIQMNPPPYGRSQPMQQQQQQQPYGMVNSPASGAYNSPGVAAQMGGNGPAGVGKPAMHPQQQQANLQGGMRPVQQQQQQQSTQQQMRAGQPQLTQQQIHEQGGGQLKSGSAGGLRTMDPQLKQIVTRLKNCEDRQLVFADLKKTPHLFAAFLKMESYKSSNDPGVANNQQDPMLQQQQQQQLRQSQQSGPWIPQQSPQYPSSGGGTPSNRGGGTPNSSSNNNNNGGGGSSSSNSSNSAGAQFYSNPSSQWTQSQQQQQPQPQPQQQYPPS